jgi:hypothetical protein
MCLKELIKLNKYMKKTSFILLLSVILVCCGQNKKQSAYEIFNKHMEKNIEVCAELLRSNGWDSIVARDTCSYLLNLAFERDSTFVFMSGQEMENFLKNLTADIQNKGL